MWQISARYVPRLLTDGQNQFLTAKMTVASHPPYSPLWSLVIYDFLG